MDQGILANKPWYKKRLGVALIIFIGICILGMSLSSIKGYARNKPDFKITAAELCREYDENPSSALKYNGRKICVTDIVGNSVRNDSYELIVHLYATKDAPCSILIVVHCRWRKIQWNGSRKTSQRTRNHDSGNIHRKWFWHTPIRWMLVFKIDMSCDSKRSHYTRNTQIETIMGLKGAIVLQAINSNASFYAFLRFT